MDRLTNTDSDKFPDDKVPYGNCYGYIFYKLGINPDEVVAGIFNKELERKWFSHVADMEEADVLAFKELEFDKYRHAVLIDRERDDALFHRGNLGWPVEETTLKKLKRTYPSSRYEYVYLKKKDKPDLK